MSPLRFCPHCGEDLRQLTEGAAPAEAAEATAPTRTIIKREVTRAEVERLWGLLPLPFHMTPFGVVVEGEEPVALACEDQKDKKQWELARGQIHNLSVAGSATTSASPVPQLPDTTKPMTVPEHLCSIEGDKGREGRGGKRYGG